MNDPMTIIGLFLILMCFIAGVLCIVIGAGHSMYALWKHRRIRRNQAVRYAKSWSTDQAPLNSFDPNRTIRR